MAEHHDIDARKIDMGHGLSLDDFNAAALTTSFMLAKAKDSDWSNKQEIMRKLAIVRQKFETAIKNKEEDIARDLVADRTDDEGNPIRLNIIHVSHPE